MHVLWIGRRRGGGHPAKRGACRGGAVSPRTGAGRARRRDAGRPRRARRTRRRAPSASARACGREVRRHHQRAHGAQRRVALHLLAVAHDLLDGGRHGLHALDLDQRRDPRGVAAEEVDRADVGRPLALDDQQPLLDEVGRLLDQRVQLQLAPLALQRRAVLQRVPGVGVHVEQQDRQQLAGARAAHADDVAVLLHHRRPAHVVDGLGAARVVHRHAAVVLEQQHAVAGRQPGLQPALVGDLAAGHQHAHAGTVAGRAPARVVASPDAVRAPPCARPRGAGPRAGGGAGPRRASWSRGRARSSGSRPTAPTSACSGPAAS